jgi:hypothetical protein
VSPLEQRLEDIPGVAAVIIDLSEDGGGINVRLEPGADETQVMERVRTLLIAYGVRSSKPEFTSESPPPRETEPAVTEEPPPDVEVTITPTETGARVEVRAGDVMSYRLVTAQPMAIAQGVADAWCRATGRPPIEVVEVALGDSGDLTIGARGEGETVLTANANVSLGWERAVTKCVGLLLMRASRVGSPLQTAV